MIYIHHDLQCLVDLLYFKKGYNLMFFLVVTAFFFFSSFSSVRYLISFSSMLPDFQASTAMLPLKGKMLHVHFSISISLLKIVSPEHVKHPIELVVHTERPPLPNHNLKKVFFILKSTLITGLHQLCTQSSSIKSGTN